MYFSFELNLFVVGVTVPNWPSCITTYKLC